MDKGRIRLDDLRAYRARVAAGVALVGGTLLDCSTESRMHLGRRRSDEEMERDVAAAAMQARCRRLGGRDA